MKAWYKEMKTNKQGDLFSILYLSTDICNEKKNGNIMKPSHDHKDSINIVNKRKLKSNGNIVKNRNLSTAIIQGTKHLGKIWRGRQWENVYKNHWMFRKNHSQNLGHWHATEIYEGSCSDA